MKDGKESIAFSVDIEGGKKPGEEPVTIRVVFVTKLDGTAAAWFQEDGTVLSFEHFNRPISDEKGVSVSLVDIDIEYVHPDPEEFGWIPENTDEFIELVNLCNKIRAMEARDAIRRRD